MTQGTKDGLIGLAAILGMIVVFLLGLESCAVKWY